MNTTPNQHTDIIPPPVAVEPVQFIIYAPGTYTPNSGGCVALHKLAHNLALLDQHSYIMADTKNPAYMGTLISEEQAMQLAALPNAFVIYPEVTCGNPLNAKHVMRWVLYFVRTYGQFGLFGENDLIYRYAPMFTLRHPQPVQGQLCAMELNLDIWENRRLPRNGSCFILKKKGHKPVIHPPGSIQLDDYAERGGNAYLADMFNRCEYFYSYDDATWLSIMAALCGCKSIVVPEAGVTAQQWYSGYPYFKYGIAYGPDQLPHALATAPLMEYHLRLLNLETLTETQQFIRQAQKLITNR